MATVTEGARQALYVTGLFKDPCSSLFNSSNTFRNSPRLDRVCQKGTRGEIKICEVECNYSFPLPLSSSRPFLNELTEDGRAQLCRGQDDRRLTIRRTL